MFLRVLFSGVCVKVIILGMEIKYFSGGQNNFHVFFRGREYSQIFHVCQMNCFWSFLASPYSQQKNKKKKDHQNRTNIHEMTGIFISIKMLFLWTSSLFESVKSSITRLEPFSGAPYFPYLRLKS